MSRFNRIYDVFRFDPLFGYPGLERFNRPEAVKRVLLYEDEEWAAHTAICHRHRRIIQAAVWTLLALAVVGLKISSPVSSVLLFLVLLIAAPFVIAHHRARREVQSRVLARVMGDLRRQRLMAVCESCGYDLRGSPGPNCPECGHDIWMLDLPELPASDPLGRLICLGCGYDLRVSPGPECPECGRTFGDQTQLRRELLAQLAHARWHPVITLAVPVLNGLLLIFITIAALLFMPDRVADPVIDFFVILNGMGILAMAYEFARRAVMRRALTGPRPCHPRDLTRIFVLALAFAVWHVACIMFIVASGAAMGLGILFRFFPYRFLLPLHIF